METSHPAVPIHAIVLAFNEEKHIGRCLDSISDMCASVLVVDSGSTDATVSICEQKGATVVHRGWINHSSQMNFAIDLLAVSPGWLLRIDADEVLPPGAAAELIYTLERLDNTRFDGVSLRRRIYFMGKRLRWGGLDRIRQLRVWRSGKGKCEDRWMDEHIVVAGDVFKSKVCIDDINLNSIDWWISKHNAYASREAIDLLNLKYCFFSQASAGPASMVNSARIKRLIKERIYNKCPAASRSFIYFIYRYLILLGVADGIAGYYFTIFQAYWYRTLVDAKVADIESYSRDNNISIVEAIIARTGVNIHKWDGGNKPEKPQRKADVP